MTETVINYELLDFTMKYILTNPENHNQGNWFHGELNSQSGTQVADQNVCGTTACFAGWASIFAGFHQIRPSVCDCGCGQIMNYDIVVDENGKEYHMMEAAAEALGLNAYQADRMFSGGNSRAELESMVTTLHDNPNALL